MAGNIARDVDEALVVFISNRAQRVAMWMQSHPDGSVGPIVWDYHVILLESLAESWRITDSDSALETPIDAARYLVESFRSVADEYSHLRPMFRIVPAGTYRSTLCSDRSHMRSTTGAWLAPPPPGPPIGQDIASGVGESNLMRFVDMDSPFVGEVCDLPGLLSRIGTR